MKRVFLLIGLVFLGKIDSAPASVHLKLGKDTLALAEPTLLTVEITNTQDSLVLIKKSHLAYTYGFIISLITPDGNIWEYKPDGIVHFCYADETKIYLQLRKGEIVTDDLFLWWTPYFPKDYRNSIEKISPGIYKIFVEYPLLCQRMDDVERTVIHSDTIEFEFMPLEKSNLDILCEIDSLSRFISKGGQWTENRPRFERIRDSNTPYNEGAWAYLIPWIRDYDSLSLEKQRFEETFPNSQFAPFIAGYEFSIYYSTMPSFNSRIGGPYYEPDVDIKADSLLEVWSELAPKSIRMLRFKEPDRFLSDAEFTERYYPQVQAEKPKKSCLFR